MISITRKTDGYELALWYSLKAKQYLHNGNILFQSYNEVDSIPYFLNAIEFSTKSICNFVGHKYDKKHDISEKLVKLSKLIPNLKTNISRAAVISSRCVGAGQQYRMLTNYGNYETLIPAYHLIKKEEVEIIKNDALEICELSHFFEKSQKYSNKINVGILNGFVDESNKNEIQCNDKKYTGFTKEEIVKFSKSREYRDRFEVNEISVSKLNSNVSIVINPFGETYPETNFKKRTVFKNIKNYIYNGGIFINIAGFPFFYGWDVYRGISIPIVDKSVVLISEGQPQELLDFTGSLLWREFNAVTTHDTDKINGPHEVNVYQSKEDIDIAGQLIDKKSTNKVNEFRSLRKETLNLIPLLRARRDDFGEVYPIGAIRHGFGYLIVCGMNTKTEEELFKIFNCVKNFCKWLLALKIEDIKLY